MFHGNGVPQRWGLIPSCTLADAVPHFARRREPGLRCERTGRSGVSTRTTPRTKAGAKNSPRGSISATTTTSTARTTTRARSRKPASSALPPPTRNVDLSGLPRATRAVPQRRRVATAARRRAGDRDVGRPRDRQQPVDERRREPPASSAENEGDWEDRRCERARAHNSGRRRANSTNGRELVGQTKRAVRVQPSRARALRGRSLFVVETRVGGARRRYNANPAGNVFANATRRFRKHGGGPNGGGFNGFARRRHCAASLGSGRVPGSKRGVSRCWAPSRRAGSRRTARRSSGRRSWRGWPGSLRQRRRLQQVMRREVARRREGSGRVGRREYARASRFVHTRRAALRAWTDWDDDDAVPAVPSGAARTPVRRPRASAGISPPHARAVGARQVRHQLGLRRLARVRRRARAVSNAVTSASNRALVLGGDSHDAWAGVIPNDRETRGSATRPSGAGTGTRTVDRRSGADDRWAAEFDARRDPPGAFERRSRAPSVLIDAGHLIANANTMRTRARETAGSPRDVVGGEQTRHGDFFVATLRPRAEDLRGEVRGVRGGGGRTAGGGRSLRRSREMTPFETRLRVRRFRGAPAEDDRDGVSRASRVAVRRVVVLRARGARHRRHLRRRSGACWVQLAVSFGAVVATALGGARGRRRGVFHPEEAPIAKRARGGMSPWPAGGPPDRDGVPGSPRSRASGERGGGGAQNPGSRLGK